MRFIEDGDEFVFHIQTALGSLSVTGTNGSSPVVVQRSSAHGTAGDSSRLRIDRDGLRIACTVVGDGPESDAEQVAAWSQLAIDAAAAVGRRNTDIRWEAIIGVLVRDSGTDHLVALAEPVTAGHVTVAPAGVCTREFRADPVLLDVQAWVQVQHSWPAIVTGVVFTYDWEPAAAAAMERLRRVCAVLTLTTGHLWVPRSRLRRSGDGQMPPLTVPTIAGVPGQYAPGVTAGERWTGAGTPRETFTVPDWAVHAIEHLDSDGGLDTAVHAHYEAMRLDVDGYSSAAHLGYVAAVEGYGMHLVPDEICECEAHGPHPKAVAEKRFRAALRTVMSNRQVKQFADGAAYDRRSLTGHRGTLHGEEPTLGHPVITMFRAPSADMFSAVPLAEMRRASRDVLVKALQDHAACELTGCRYSHGINPTSQGR